jgi:hypothetical protein
MVDHGTRDGSVSLDIPTGPPFTTDTEGVRDIRVKLGLAAGATQRQQ